MIKAVIEYKDGTKTIVKKKSYIELADYMENLYPDRADAHAFRHFIYKEQGDSAKAEESKNAALKINPGMSL